MFKIYKPPFVPLALGFTLLSPLVFAAPPTPAESVQGLKAQVGVTADGIAAAQRALDQLVQSSPSKQIDLAGYSEWIAAFRQEAQTALDEYKRTIETEIYAPLAPYLAAYRAISEAPPTELDEGQKEKLIVSRRKALDEAQKEFNRVHWQALERLFQVGRPFPAQIRVEQRMATNWKRASMGSWDREYFRCSKSGKYRIYLKDENGDSIGHYDARACGTYRGIISRESQISEEDLYDNDPPYLSTQWTPFDWTVHLPDAKSVIFSRFLRKYCDDNRDCQILKGEAMRRWWTALDELAKDIEVTLGAGTPFTYLFRISSAPPSDAIHTAGSYTTIWFRSFL